MSTRNVSKLLFVVLAIAGCATVTPDMPPITEAPTGLRHVGMVVWHDLLTNRPAESRRFYGELFGWEFERPGLDLGFAGSGSYMLIRHNGKLIGGMLDTHSLGRKENISQWVSIMSVDDVAGAVARLDAAGGTVLTPPTRLPSRGTLAVVEDPTGALFAMVESRDGDPAERGAEYHDFLWNELWTDDIDGAGDFYREVIGLERNDHPIAGDTRSYHVLEHRGRARAGILANPFEGERPVWISYLRVQDPAAITARVEALGGRVIADAEPRPIGGTVALIAGPSGAGIALQTWPLDK